MRATASLPLRAENERDKKRDQESPGSDRLTMMRAVDIIRHKRDGEELSREEIAWMVAGIARGDVADYQWSALLMAILWKGMTTAETASLCDAMMRSGEIV